MKPDYPFYNGEPLSFTVRQWTLLLLLCLLAFLLLTFLGLLFVGPVSQLFPVILFLLVPLAGLGAMGRGCLSALFRPLTMKAILLMPAFALLNLLVSVAVALVVVGMADVSANPAVGLIRALDPVQFAAFLLRTLPQLVGEELITILPLLALLAYLVQGRGWSRRAAIVAAWLTTALLFGILHLPTYQWNLAQSIFIIGAARMVLTGAYLLTGNLWVSAGAHIVSDWLIFFAAYLLPDIDMQSLQ